ncbi:MAG: transaldolase / glucose-6-phosphate isomerase, partial [Solirubrobacteraceae bacterium]|nr:transaldolase / glucose-6-phosphate isomerase [Solirubrobacteraceae bacterium]
QREGGLRLHVLDSTEPLQIAAVEAEIDVAKTLFIVSTKSGGTIETLSLFKHFHALQGEGGHFIAVTDPGSTLVDLAEEHGFRRTFLNDSEIGGRYSALSYFGLVPAALAGVDVRPILEGAQVAEQACSDFEAPEDNSGLWLGLALGELARAGRDKLTFVVDDPLGSFGIWAEQLVAESTGKQGRGIFPIADEPVLAADAYGPDRVFLHLRNTEAPDARHDDHIAALAEAGHPTITVQAAGPDDLGRVFFLSEFATAVVGWVLEINPFDQPNVQQAKDATKRVLDEGSPDLEDGDLAALLGGLEPPAYLAIMGYLPYSAEIEAAVGRLREAVIERHHTATTYGYGPRFLHSTGQFHKGGPAVGRFLQFVHDAEADAEIPGEDFDFRTLIAAQADGDLQTLRDHGLEAVRVRLNSGDLPGAIDDLRGSV